MAAERRGRSASPNIVWRCAFCKKPISDDGGYITVDLAAVRRFAVADAEWEAKVRAENDGRLVVHGEAWTTMPDRPRWTPMHSSCDPDPDGVSYWFNVQRARTALQLLDWTLHLSEKNWFANTEWSALLYSAVPGLAFAS